MSAYVVYLEREITALRAQSESLKASERRDEAALCQVEINIDEICLTVYNVCRKLVQDGAFSALYLEKLDRLPAGWAQSRAAALAHGDDCKAIIEDIKLSVLARNRAKYLELKEV